MARCYLTEAFVLDLTVAHRVMRGLGRRLEQVDAGAAGVRAMAMGFEGQAAAAYWSHLASLLPAGAGFKGRVTRDAGDPVNQAINYVYGMLYGQVWRALVKAGLDPYFGIMHGSERDRGSLVFDLIEEFRAPFCRPPRRRPRQPRSQDRGAWCGQLAAPRAPRSRAQLHPIVDAEDPLARATRGSGRHPPAPSGRACEAHQRRRRLSALSDALVSSPD